MRSSQHTIEIIATTDQAVDAISKEVYDSAGHCHWCDQTWKLYAGEGIRKERRCTPKRNTRWISLDSQTADNVFNMTMRVRDKPTRMWLARLKEDDGRIRARTHDTS